MEIHSPRMSVFQKRFGISLRIARVWMSTSSASSKYLTAVGWTLLTDVQVLRVVASCDLSRAVLIVH